MANKPARGKTFELTVQNGRVKKKKRFESFEKL